MDEREYQEKLGQVREEIDAIDKQLLPLFLAAWTAPSGWPG